jgi:hypothetical protein
MKYDKINNKNPSIIKDRKQQCIIVTKPFRTTKLKIGDNAHKITNIETSHQQGN